MSSNQPPKSLSAAPPLRRGFFCPLIFGRIFHQKGEVYDKGGWWRVTEKDNHLQQPVRITLAIVMWALILWVLTLGVPALVPVAKAIFIVAVLPTGLVEWFVYKGLVKEKSAVLAKILLVIAAALLWYYVYR